MSALYPYLFIHKNKFHLNGCCMSSLVFLMGTFAAYLMASLPRYFILLILMNKTLAFVFNATTNSYMYFKNIVQEMTIENKHNNMVQA